MKFLLAREAGLPARLRVSEALLGFAWEYVGSMLTDCSAWNLLAARPDSLFLPALSQCAGTFRVCRAPRLTGAYLARVSSQALPKEKIGESTAA